MSKQRAAASPPTDLFGRALLPAATSVSRRRISNAADDKKVPAHDGAAQGRRLRAFLPSTLGPGAIATFELRSVRDRSRALARNFPQLAGAIDLFAANLVGTGIKPQSTAADPDWRRAVHEVWSRWVDQADSQGMTDFYGLQNLAARALFDSGEIFFRRRFRLASDGLPVPYQLQAIEADHLPPEKTMRLGKGAGAERVVAGVEFNPIGQRVAYWMLPEHPGEAVGSTAALPARIPAAEIRHVYRLRRPGDVRGWPALAPVVLKAYELLKLDEAMLRRADVAARFAAFIKMNGEPTPMGAAAAAAGEVALDPGLISLLAPGEDIVIANPPEFGSSYDPFTKAQMRALATACGLTYEQLSGDLSGVNYSSIRAGLVEFRRRATVVQLQVLAFHLCRPTWPDVLDQAILAGTLPMPQGYGADPAPWQSVRWVPQTWDWVDPLKDIAAVVAQIRAGLISRSEAVSMYGYDAEQIDQEIAADNARADALGLVFDTDPRKTSRAGLTQARPPGSEIPGGQAPGGSPDDDSGGDPSAQ